MKKKYYLNFIDLSEDAQDRLLQDARDDLIEEYGENVLKEEAENMNIDYETYITERAERHMYSFDFVFNI